MSNNPFEKIVKENNRYEIGHHFDALTGNEKNILSKAILKEIDYDDVKDFIEENTLRIESKRLNREIKFLEEEKKVLEENISLLKKVELSFYERTWWQNFKVFILKKLQRSLQGVL